MGKKRRYGINFGNSTTGPIGCVAIVYAKSPEAALRKFRRFLAVLGNYEYFLPISNLAESEKQLVSLDYVAVYFNPEALTLKDVYLAEFQKED